MTTTLVIRLSSMGDVAISIPVLYSIASKYPSDNFILLTQNTLISLFIEKPTNLTVIPVYTKGKHKGIAGLINLLRELAPLLRGNKVKVADLHGVLRSFFIDSYFWLRGNQVAIIDKGRKEKQELIGGKNRKKLQLKTTLDRYRDVFEKLHYNSSLSFAGLFSEKPVNKQIRIGIAPFAKHQGKAYSLNLMEDVVRRLSESNNYQIVLFSSKAESEILKPWENAHKNVTLVEGKMSLHEELILMNQMDLMLSMDSANMHLASLVSTPVISIWGATHPYAGFYGFNQDESNIIQIDNLPCRPCSIFGNKPCSRNDYACLTQITPDMIINKIRNYFTQRMA